MELAERQRRVVRLATDSTARQSAEPRPEGLDRFAGSLIEKRLAEVRSLLPRTYVFLGKEFDRCFRQWAASRPSRAPHRHHRDAVLFARTLDQDLPRYEAAGIEAWLGDEPKLGLFLLSKDLADAPSKPVSTLILWMRGPRARLRELRLWPPL